MEAEISFKFIKGKKVNSEIMLSKAVTADLSLLAWRSMEISIRAADTVDFNG